MADVSLGGTSATGSAMPGPSESELMVGRWVLLLLAELGAPQVKDAECAAADLCRMRAEDAAGQRMATTW